MALGFAACECLTGKRVVHVGAWSRPGFSKFCDVFTHLAHLRASVELARTILLSVMHGIMVPECRHGFRKLLGRSADVFLRARPIFSDCASAVFSHNAQYPPFRQRQIVDPHASGVIAAHALCAPQTSLQKWARLNKTLQIHHTTAAQTRTSFSMLFSSQSIQNSYQARQPAASFTRQHSWPSPKFFCCWKNPFVGRRLR